MHSDSLVQLALNAQGCNQKDLAQLLHVSPAQVSKWKKGEHMSSEMEDRLRVLAEIGDRDPDVVLWSGSCESADKWQSLFRQLASFAADDEETGYHTYLLEEPEEDTALCWHTLNMLREMGVEIPQPFPQQLDVDFDAPDPEGEAIWTFLLEENEHSSLVYQTYKALTDVYGFYQAYVADFLEDDGLSLGDTPACNIEACLLLLAASKLDPSPSLATRFREFKRKVEKDYEEWLSIVKDAAFRAGIPLRAELLNMVFESSDGLGHEAEAQSLGFNSTRIHPDVYMNELLCGMRAIHQILPVIMKKLGIHEEFVLDESDFRMNRH